jgi:isoleucyl-tRNA synthetase
LSADVILYANDALLSVLTKLGDELRFVLITSSVKVLPLSDQGTATDIKGLSVTISASKEKKCDRCWHHSESVGGNQNHPDLCLRCDSNIYGQGEERFHA